MCIDYFSHPYFSFFKKAVFRLKINFIGLRFFHRIIVYATEVYLRKAIMAAEEKRKIKIPGQAAVIVVG